MTVPLPNYTFTVTPPGGSPIDYTTHLAFSGGPTSPTISQHFGRQGDTASFPLMEEYADGATPTINIPVFSTVKFVDNTVGQTLFAGVCNDPTLTVYSPNLRGWSLQCTDFAFYADSAIVHGTFFGLTVDQIVVALTKQANCGIKADTVANGGFVATAPQLASFVTNYTTLSSAWRKLAILAGQNTPYGWYVDENYNLHFYDETTAVNSGVTFTTTPTVEGSQTEGHIKTDGFHYEWDGTAVRNRVLVQGATNTIYYGNTSKPPTDTWQGNGVQNSWPLRYTVIGTPVVTINGVKQTSELVESGNTSTATWQIVQSNIGSWSLVTTGNPPAQGSVIKIWYSYLVPIVAQANDFNSQATYPGPNGGIFSTYILDRSLTTTPMALNRAMRERTEYAFAVERASFGTSEDWIGWVRSGEICTIVNQFVPDAQNGYTMGINAQFLVIGNSVNFDEQGYRSSSITAVRVF